MESIKLIKYLGTGVGLFYDSLSEDSEGQTLSLPTSALRPVQKQSGHLLTYRALQDYFKWSTPS